MLLDRPAKAVTLLLSLVIVTAGYCAPTVSVDRPVLAIPPSCPSDYVDTPAATADVTQLSEAYSSHLANIADELLKPPADLTGSAASLPAGATSLPPVPGALFMGLTGFLCVSLVKDRKLWMAALAGLLWAGQAGFAALPQLAQHLASRKQTEQIAPANLTYTPQLLHSDRLRSDIEGTQYIGLLHHLAGIPDNRTSFLRKQESKSTSAHVRTPQFVITEVLTGILSVTKRLVRITKWHFYFSPAFIFVLLPRGPP